MLDERIKIVIRLANDEGWDVNEDESEDMIRLVDKAGRICSKVAPKNV